MQLWHTMLVGLLLTAGLRSTAIEGFLHVAPGAEFPSAALPDLAGRPQPVLVPDRPTVVLFLRPGQAHTRALLDRLPVWQREFKEPSIRWVAIVSDRIPRPQLTADLQPLASNLVCLTDPGDRFYGRVGVVQEPAVALVDARGRLRAFQAFTKVNFTEILRPRIQLLLGQITEAELRQALAPTPPEATQTPPGAHTRFRLAEHLLATGKTNQAMATLRQCVAQDPKSVEAHTLLGELLVATGDRTAAGQAFAAALALEPGNARARRGAQHCSRTAANDP